jgi:hypothetical protein
MMLVQFFYEVRIFNPITVNTEGATGPEAVFRPVEAKCGLCLHQIHFSPANPHPLIQHALDHGRDQRAGVPDTLNLDGSYGTAAVSVRVDGLQKTPEPRQYAINRTPKLEDKG